MSFILKRSFNQLRFYEKLTRILPRHLHEESAIKIEKDQELPTASRQIKFQVFRNEEATEILDIEEERQKIYSESQSSSVLTESIYQNLNLQSRIIIKILK